MHKLQFPPLPALPSTSQPLHTPKAPGNKTVLLQKNHNDVQRDKWLNQDHIAKPVSEEGTKPKNTSAAAIPASYHRALYARL